MIHLAMMGLCQIFIIVPLVIGLATMVLTHMVTMAYMTIENSGGYKKQTLKQIISGTQGGLSLASNTPTLYAFSLHGYAKVLTADIPGAFLSADWQVDVKVKVNSVLDNGATDFCQARD